MHGRIAIFVFLNLAIGCIDTTAPVVPIADPPDANLAKDFDPTRTGTIEGRVVWEGDLPTATETIVRANAYNPYMHQKPARFRTPHVPIVHPKTHGIAGAVVYLKGIDLKRSKPWDHAKPHVMFQDRKLLIEQGDIRSGVGFVRRGAAIDISNRDDEYHRLLARGKAFFALPLIEPKQTHERILKHEGLVDLTCGMGCYWLNAHLFVAEHPYYTRTDAEGKFVLKDVPTGNYEIVCWLPSWRVERTERDPETATIARLAWHAPEERTQKVRVEAGRGSDITYRWKLGDFK